MSIGVGIAGWGAISEQLHGPCLSGMEECEIVAVCDEREERLAHAADTYRCRGYTDLDAFFDHPGLDLVVIPLPNFLHGPTAVRAQAAGKHVISEKPMSFSPKEAEHLVKTGKEKGLVVTTHQNRRWDPNFVAIRQLRENGELGKLHMIQSRHLGSPWKKTWADSSKWTGKGPFMSMGPHLLDQILSMSPDGPIQVSGVLKSILNEDDTFNCFLTFSDDSTARVEMTKASRLKDYRRFELSFEKGDALVSGRSDPYTLRIQRDGEAATEEILPEPPEFHIQSRPFYQNIFAAIRGEEELIVKPEQSLRYVKVADAIVRSAEQGETMTVE